MTGGGAVAFATSVSLQSRCEVRVRATTPRAALAREKKVETAKSSRYVGQPPVVRRGRLRVGVERFTEPPRPPPIDADKYSWSRGGYNSLTRSTAIWSFIFVLLSRNYLDNRRISYFLFRKTDEKLRARRRALAAWSRGQILNLGPTMIKVGQLAAAREDILPSEVTEELLELTDKVPAFSWEAVETMLEREYGRPVEEVFQWFDKTPLAAASLGQVHRACLPSGELVIVKIQRPGLRQLFDLDLDALRDVAQYLQNSKQYGGDTRDWVGIYEECRQTLYEEIDYRLELENADEFRRNFADTPWAIVPKSWLGHNNSVSPLRECARGRTVSLETGMANLSVLNRGSIGFRNRTDIVLTGTVLCLQYAPGISVRDTAGMEAAGIDPAVIADRSAQLLLQQILDHATFQSDPHVGNISVTPSAGGSIIMYDFGMVGRLNPRIKEQLVDILLGVIEKDADVVMNTLVDLGALVLPSDPQPVKRSIQFFLDSVGSRPTRDQTVAAIGDDLYSTAQDRPFRLPAASVFLLRAFSTTEGVCKTLDPSFSFAGVSKPYADALLRGRGRGDADPLSPGLSLARSLADAALTGKPDALATQLRKQVVGTGANLAQAAGRIEKTERTLARLESGDVRVRARSFQTERLLRRQFLLSQASNYLVVSAAAAVLSVELAASGLGTTPAGVAGGVSALAAAVFVRKSAAIGKEPFSSGDK